MPHQVRETEGAFERKTWEVDDVGRGPRQEVVVSNGVPERQGLEQERYLVRRVLTLHSPAIFLTGNRWEPSRKKAGGGHFSEGTEKFGETI